MQGDAADSESDGSYGSDRQEHDNSIRQGLRRSLRSAGIYALKGLIGATVCVLAGFSDDVRDSLRR